ncbi:DNA sulfur modification protein DndD [Priestia aryabhattai]|uniref:DNA sulfur modification protein DndD n=1 Tax=Priestia aryabhattai TaxID=412384 RepID=UPI003D29D544
MLLKKVTFNDFRLYKGLNEIDLSIPPASKRNIILIGAQNGSGKTSILEGILLALYGRQANLTSGETYDQLVRESINMKSYRSGNRKFFIEVEFENSHDETAKRKLVIKREWRIRDNECLEELTIEEDECELKQFEDEIDKTQFIQSIIPSGVSQFFFFDAEKIQYMADDNDYEDSLTNSIRDILNINIYQKLLEDLHSFEQNLKRNQPNAKSSDITKIEYQIELATEKIQDEESELDKAQLSLEKLTNEIIQIKKWLREQGIGSLTKRVDIQEEVDLLKERREELRDEVISFLDNELPYVLLFPILEETIDQLLKEASHNEAIQLSKQSHENFYNLLEVLNSKRIIPPLTQIQKEAIAHEIQIVWAQINKPVIRENIKILHDLSKSDLDKLSNKIKSLISYLSSGNSDLKKRLDLYEETTIIINDKIQQLKQLPTNDKVIQKENMLERLEEEKNLYKETVRICQNRIDELNSQKKILQNQRNELIDQIEVSRDLQKKINESIKMRKVLSEFTSQLTVEKAKDVETLLTEVFNKLVRKNNLIKKFCINPTTFEVTAENMAGEFLPKRRLSAGEKEIFSIALIWALAKASQRPLPIVIDTPLGRLDKVHRTNLLKHYFPYASQQVIILSTDGEVADEWKEMINEYVAKEYLIVDKGEYSIVSDGYFIEKGTGV